MDNEEREARRMWFATLHGLLAASMRASLDGNHARSVDLETAKERMRVVGASLGWKAEDAARDVLSGDVGRQA